MTKKTKLKIAQIAPPWVSIPPEKYGGTETVISNLTEELVRRGHEVTLFASGNSKTKAKLVSAFPRALYESGVSWTNGFYPLYHAVTAFERANEFDIIHDHFQFFGLCFSAFVETPMVSTHHGDFETAEKDAAKYQILKKFRHNYFVSISESQRKHSSLNLNFVATVYNGIDLKDFKFSDNCENYLVWLGRITEKKGVLIAIEAAEKAGLPLKIAAKVDMNNPPDVEFFEKKVKPLIDGKNVEFLGEVDFAQRNDLLGKAMALLNPIQWNEPFGLVMPEAMACGAPVIAFDRGAAREIVKDGQNGFIVNPLNKNKEVNIEGLVEAIKNIRKINRKECRKTVEEKFTVGIMADKYEEVYYKILEEKKIKIRKFWNKILTE